MRLTRIRRLAVLTDAHQARARLAARAAPVLLAPALLALSACTGDGAHDGLRDSQWRFTVIDGRKPHDATAHLRFGSRLDVALGCNAISGPWKIAENRLLAGPMATTEMACLNDSWPQEQAIGALLASSPRLLMDGDRMTLQSSGHTAELVRVSED